MGFELWASGPGNEGPRCISFSTSFASSAGSSPVSGVDKAEGVAAADDAEALGRGSPTPLPDERTLASHCFSRHESRGSADVAESDVPHMIAAANRSQIANRQSAISNPRPT